jgi:hypothetical protein
MLIFPTMYVISVRLSIAIALCALLGACSSQSQSHGGDVERASAGGPVAVSITPNTGSGSHQVFTFVTSDPQGASHLYRTHIQFRTAGKQAVTCYIAILPPSSIDLMADGLERWLPAVATGTAEILENQSCSVNPSTSSVQEESTNRTVKLDITFKSPMSGMNTISLNADDRQGDMSPPLNGSWSVQ